MTTGHVHRLPAKRLRAACVARLAIAPSIVGCGGDLCDAGAIVAALERAAAGDTVRLGACLIEGAFEVPSGVAVEGRGAEETLLIAPPGRPGLVLSPGAMDATCVRRLGVESSGPVGILARGTGSACLEDLSVRATLGVGVGAEGLSRITLSAMTISGPVTSANQVSVPDPVTPMDSATHGLVLVRVGMASLAEVSVSGFAAAGALFSASSVAWSGGGAPRNLSLGLLVEGGSAVLGDVDLSETLGQTRLEPAYGGAFLGGVSVESHRLRVNDGEGRGLFHQGATGIHEEIEAFDNQNVAVWFEDVPSFELTGRISRNRIAGVVAVDSQNIGVHDAQIDRSVRTTRVFPGSPPIDVGDGIQLVRTSTGVRVARVSLDGNERVGLLLDLGGATLDPTALQDVTVLGSGASLGVIAQGGTLPVGWDSSVVRPPDIRANDLAFSGLLDVVEGVGPCSMPRPGDVVSRGLVALIGF